MSGSTTDVAAPPWRFGARVDLLEIGLTRHGQRSEAPYAHLCNTMAGLAKDEHYRGLTVLAVSRYAIQAKSYKDTYRIDVDGREVASIACQPKRPFPNTPGILLRIHYDLLNQLGMEDDFECLMNLILPGVYQSFVARIRRLELAFDVPVRLSDLAWWKDGNNKATQYENTIYLGTRRSKNGLCGYDKGKQLREKGINQPKDILRLEWRLQSIPMTGRKQALHQHINLLKKLHLVSKQELAQVFSPAQHPGLWLAVQQGNLTPALKGLGKAKQKKLRQRLKAIPTPDWYQPDLIHQALLQAAEQCLWLP